MDGSCPGAPNTWPTNLSARHNVGSIDVPTPINPPGTAYCRWFCSACNDTMRLIIGKHLWLPFASLVTIPGRISTSCPTRRTPVRMDPPATPPRRSSTSEPGLFTSKERMTIRRGEDVKSRTGMGIVFTMYSFTASMLYFSWAEMGTMGECSATVPGLVKRNVRMPQVLSGIGQTYL
jgi:hypothetical protein